MAKPVVYRWIAADDAAVCLNDSDAAVNSYIVLNGTLSTGGNPNITGLSSQPPAIVYFDKIVRNLSIFCPGDISNRHFEITGTVNGSEIFETIVGPDSTTVYTINAFDAIKSIFVDGVGGVAGVNIGTGQVGYTQWFASNYYAINPQTSVQVDVTGTITYSFEATLDDVNVTPESQIETYHLIDDMVDATTSLFAGPTDRFRYARIRISASTGAATLTARIMQQE
jgi:hypothetical protein